MRYNMSSTKQILAALILAALLVIVFFSFATMTHIADGRMQSNCPFSTMGAPLCPQDVVAVAVHHISAYQSLLNAPLVPSVSMFIVVLLMLVYGAFIFLVCSPLPKPYLVRYFYNSPPSYSRSREITRWLSLFEHSPSLL